MHRRDPRPPPRRADRPGDAPRRSRPTAARTPSSRCAAGLQGGARMPRSLVLVQDPTMQRRTHAAFDRWRGADEPEVRSHAPFVPVVGEHGVGESASDVGLEPRAVPRPRPRRDQPADRRRARLRPARRRRSSATWTIPSKRRRGLRAACARRTPAPRRDLTPRDGPEGARPPFVGCRACPPTRPRPPCSPRCRGTTRGRWCGWATTTPCSRSAVRGARSRACSTYPSSTARPTTDAPPTGCWRSRSGRSPSAASRPTTTARRSSWSTSTSSTTSRSRRPSRRSPTTASSSSTAAASRATTRSTPSSSRRSSPTRSARARAPTS